MRVLNVINGLGTGGAERSLAELLPLYQQRGVDVTVACFYHRSEGVESELLAAGYDVRFLDRAGTLGRVRAIRRLSTAEHFDLIHTQLFEADIAGRLAGVGTGVPVLTSLVNTSYGPARLGDPNVSRYKLEAVRLIDSWSGRLMTDHFHAISKTVKDASVAALGIDPSQITVVERGRDPGRLGTVSPERRVETRRRLGLDRDVPVLVNVGRQEYQKGQSHLLRAMAALRDEGSEAVLLLVGREGNVTKDLQVLHAQLRLDGVVRVLGHREDVPDLLAASDLFVFPSLFEGIAGAVLEAMAMSLPVVASDIPAMREVLDPGGNCLLVPPASPADLADAIRTLLGDSDMRQRFSVRSKARFDSRYTLESVADRMVQLYQTVVDSQTAGRPTSH